MPKMLRAVAPLIHECTLLLPHVGTVADFFFSAKLRPYDHGRVDSALRTPTDEFKLKAGQMFQPIRVAVCGPKNTPPLYETLEVLARDTVVNRLDFALGPV